MLPEVFETRDQRLDFRAMFSQPAYNKFLAFVVKNLGTHRFTGVMKAFDLNPWLLVSL
jgi:hypothetical protein